MFLNVSFAAANKPEDTSRPSFKTKAGFIVFSWIHRLRFILWDGRAACVGPRGAGLRWVTGVWASELLCVGGAAGGGLLRWLIFPLVEL